MSSIGTPLTDVFIISSTGAAVTSGTAVGELPWIA
jgi:hypothetical protein